MVGGLLGQFRLGLGEELFGLMLGFGGDLPGLFLHGVGDLGAGLLRGVGDVGGLLFGDLRGGGVATVRRRVHPALPRWAAWPGAPVGRCPHP